jgi:archaellum biogenesis ATPase FlaH
MLTFDQIHKYFETRLGHSLQTHDKVSIRCPFHDDKNPSATVFLKSGGFHCNGCGAKGGLIEFEMRFSKCDRETARKYIEEITGASLSDGDWKLEGTYYYRNADGVVAKKERYRKPDGEKVFIWYHRDSAGKWVKGLPADVPRLLYNQPELTTCNLPMFAEGEGCADELAAEAPKLWPERQAKGLRIAVTTNGEGAWKPGEKPKWRPEYTQQFGGKPGAILFEDNDEPGRTLIAYVAAQIAPLVKKVRIVTFRNQREHYDVKNWLEEHRDDPDMIAKLEHMIEHAPLYKPQAGAKPGQDSVGLKLKRGTEIVERAQVWEVYDFIPCDTLIIVIGEIGLGKTRMCVALCADISQGRIPVTGGDRAGGKRTVLLISNEDSEARIREMFVEMGGDLAKLYVEDEDSDLPWNLSHIASLEARIAEIKPAIVVIDSLSTYRPDGVNLWNHSEVAPYLVKLRKLANRQHCVIVLIHHDNKTVTDDPIRKASGTKGIPGTARHNLLVGPDKDGGDNSRIAVTFKTNLARDRNRAYRFQILPKFEWTGQVTTTAREVLRRAAAEDLAARQSRRERTEKVPPPPKQTPEEKEKEKAERTTDHHAKGKVALSREMLRRESAGEDPILKRQAEDYLTTSGFTRRAARAVTDDSIFRKVAGTGPGHPTELHLPLPVVPNTPSTGSHTAFSAEIPPPGNPNNDAGLKDSDFGRPHGQGTAEIPPTETRMDKGDFEPPISAATQNFPNIIGTHNFPAEITAEINPGPEAVPDGLVERIVLLVKSGEASDDNAIVEHLPEWPREDVLRAKGLAIAQGRIGERDHD